MNYRIILLFALVVTLFWASLPQVCYLLCALVARLFHGHVSYRPWAWASLVMVVLWWAMYAYGHYVGRFGIEVREHHYAHPTIPAAYDGYRIVHISDLHLDGWDGHETELQHVVQLINALRPHLIVFTGDLVSMSHTEIDAHIHVLRQLQAPDGVISVLGNHDYSPYLRGISASQRRVMLDSLCDKERHLLGWTLLCNEHRVLHRDGDSIAIVGVENQSCGAHSVVRRGQLHRALRGSEGMFRILLSHDPTHWRAEVLHQTDVPLTLSGHTHAMQMRVLGWTPSRWVYPECDGLYAEDGQSLYVNVGLGGTLPMRVGATPEVTLHILHSQP